MTKTPEELTAEWKLNKKRNGYFYYQDVNKDIYVSQWYKLNPAIYVKVLAPVLSYDEYKAIQEELAEHRHYCCCMENEVMRLELAKLEEEIAELKEKIKKREELIQCLGSNIDELDVKKSVLIIENNKLRGLLKECLPIVSAEIMTWQIRGGEESYKRGQDLLTRINATLGESEVK